MRWNGVGLGSEPSPAAVMRQQQQLTVSTWQGRPNDFCCCQKALCVKARTPHDGDRNVQVCSACQPFDGLLDRDLDNELQAAITAAHQAASTPASSLPRGRRALVPIIHSVMVCSISAAATRAERCGDDSARATMRGSRGSSQTCSRMAVPA